MASANRDIFVVYLCFSLWDRIVVCSPGWFPPASNPPASAGFQRCLPHCALLHPHPGHCENVLFRNVTGLAEMKILQRDTCVFQYDYQIIKAMDPREVGISPEISCWVKQGGACLWKIPEGSKDWSDHLAGRDWSQTWPGAGRTTCWLGLFSMCVSWPSVYELYLHFRPPPPLNPNPCLRRSKVSPGKEFPKALSNVITLSKSLFPACHC